MHEIEIWAERLWRSISPAGGHTEKGSSLRIVHVLALAVARLLQANREGTVHALRDIVRD